MRTGLKNNETEIHRLVLTLRKFNDVYLYVDLNR